jgi:diguanylate cyclase (GGDEF)-like protein
LQFVSTHDDLTGLPNRTLLTDRLEHIIAFVKRHENKAAVLFIDLDEFKTINDSLGHSFGDKLLQMVSERLLFQLREEDTIARFGGDEFVVIISKFTHMLDVSNIAEKLLFVINQPYMIDGHDINVTGSIGISICPDDSDIAETLIQNADTAMYLSKGMGRNAYQFYTKAIHEKVVRKHQLEEALRRAIVENQFVLHYQAKVSLVTKQIYGMEALIRWQHPEFGMIPPDEFIALAEETGLIVEIGEWVIREACTAMKSWLTMYPWLDNISINLSVRQFKQEAFIANVLSILSDIDIDNRCIDFEITESIIMDDVEKAITILTDLRALGISISIDDFGTGYSSLNYLKRLPADTLKIDRTFVRDLSTDSADQAIIKSIIALATNLKLDVIAEGIEDRDQEALLTGMGCYAAQGYFYSKPISKEAMSELLMVQAEQME